MTTRVAFLLCAAASTLCAQGTITTFAGTEWVFGGDGKPALTAPLAGVDSVTIDPRGNVVVSDPDNAMVVRLNRDGTLTVIAGNGLEGYSGDGGPAVNASLNSPQGIAYDSKGNLYIADQVNCRIRRVDTNGIITTAAGNGFPGVSGNGGQATNATLFDPLGLAIDSADNVYFTDNRNTIIRKIAPNGVISLVAGNPQSNTIGEGGLATNANLGDIEDIAAGPKGVIYLADFAYHAVRKVDTNTGIITTLAGTPLTGGYSGDNGPANKAMLNSPGGVTVDGSGNVFISDTNNFVVRKVDTNGNITTFAGSHQFGFTPDGPATSAQFRSLFGLVADSSGSLFITDEDNHMVRRIANGSVTTVAGIGFSGPGTFRFTPDQAPAGNAYFFQPFGISFDSAGNLLIADSSNNRIRKITPAGAVSTIAGNGGREFSGDGPSATSVALAGPLGVAASKTGNIYVADTDNNRVRRISANGAIATVAGNNKAGYSGDGGAAAQNSLFHPYAVVVDASENLYIADFDNNRVRIVSSNGIINTYAGNGKGAFAGDNGPATSASLNGPTALALDASGNLYVADFFNHRVRKVTTSGTITTVAQVQSPFGLALDAAGNLYVSDGATNQVFRIAAATGNSTVVAGNGSLGFTGDGGPSTQASLNIPNGIAVDGSGSLFIADSFNNRIRQILATPLTLQSSASSLAFSGKSGGALTDAQQFSLSTRLGSAPGPATSYGLSVSTSDGGNWLTTSPLTGTTPGIVQVFADPSSLTAGQTYHASIVITAPGATPPSITIPVTVTLDPPVPSVLGLAATGLDPNGKLQGNTLAGALTFSAVQGDPPVSQLLSVLNTGGGSLSYTVTASTDNGGNWLSVTAPGVNMATPVAPGSLAVQADPSGLTPGTYTGTVAVTGDNGTTLQAAVILTIAKVPRKLFLSQPGLTFTAVAGGGAPLDQTFAVLNIGRGTVNWTVDTQTLDGNDGWLIVTPPTAGGGSSTAGASIVPVVDVAVDTSKLAPGAHYAQIRIASPDADNSPQRVMVEVDVQPAGTNPPPQVQPTGLVFLGAPGSVPGSQTLFVSNPGGAAVTYSSSLATADGSPWFVIAPTNGTIAPSQLGQPARILVQPDFTKLPAGIYTGTIRLNFGSSVSTVTVTAVVGSSGGTGSQSALHPNFTAGANCSQGMTVTLMKPQPGFSAIATNSFPIQANVFDACNNPVVPTSGNQATAKARILVNQQFQPEVALSFSNGTWQGTWTAPNTTQTATVQMYVLVTAALPGGIGATSGQNTAISGTLAPKNLPATPQMNSAVQNAASFASSARVVPGGLVSVFGAAMADTTNTAEACLPNALTPPLPTQLAGVQVYLGDQPLALLYACDSQINAQIPYDLPADIQDVQLWMRRVNNQGTAQATGVLVSSTSSWPAIFTSSQNGQGQGAILAADGVTPNSSANPAGPGDLVIVLATGLGGVNPAVNLGQPAPAAPPSQTQNLVKVTIGGVTAPLAAQPQLLPNSSGVYEVQVIVPQGVPAGDQPLVLSVLGLPSQSPVTIALHQ